MPPVRSTIRLRSTLGLGFPGGKVIDELAQKGNPLAIKFPRPMRNSGDYQFSFSGIKTSVRYFVEKARRAGILLENGQENAKDANSDTVTVEDIAASFQAAVVDVLTYKSIRAAKVHRCQNNHVDRWGRRE